MITLFVYLAYFLTSSHFVFDVRGSKDTKDFELRLRTNLFENHSSKTLPSLNKTTPVRVNLSLTLRQIIDVDEKNQVMVTSIWFRQFWKDYILTWNSTEYNGVKELHLNKNDVWVPDMSVYNTASSYGILYQRLDTSVVLKENGEISWLAPVKLKTECKINVKYFPFDDQICRVTFGSWTYHGFQVDLYNVSTHADVGDFVENTEWHLLEAYFTRQVKKYPCCEEPYPTVTVHIHIRRRALFYLFNLVIPCGVIALLASLAFCLPSNNGERISLVVTVLLSLTVYMLIVSETMPPTSEVVPLIGKFYISTMLLIALTLAAVCLTLNCYEQETRMSRWLRKLLLCVLEKPFTTTNAIGIRVNGAFVTNEDAEKKPTTQAVGNDNIHNTTETNQQPLDAIPVNSPTRMKTTARGLEEAVLQSKIATQKENKLIKTEWKNASKALDRLFFLLFFVSFIIMTAVVFSEAPRIVLT